MWRNIRVFISFEEGHEMWTNSKYYIMRSFHSSEYEEFFLLISFNFQGFFLNNSTKNQKRLNLTRNSLPVEIDMILISR